MRANCSPDLTFENSFAVDAVCQERQGQVNCGQGLVSMARRSIEVEGLHHSGNPIPAASRVDRLVVTGGIYGMDPETGAVAPDATDQVRLTFWQLGRVLEAAGATFDDIAKLTFYVKTKELRPTINEFWLHQFPDPSSRPARHMLVYDNLPGDILVQCEAIAMVPDDA